MQGLPDPTGTASLPLPSISEGGMAIVRSWQENRARILAVLLLVALLAGMAMLVLGGIEPFGKKACDSAKGCTRIVMAEGQQLPKPPPLPGREAVPPAILAQTAPDAARSLNASAPFFKGLLIAARPFQFAGSADDRSRATECLAAAQLYEAGYGEGDQKAVAQVILNRVRHPAFPHTVCGVVFEGSERVTGCQFTFTCDGALTRHYPEAAWERARKLAARMLDGEVDNRIGWSTHYHTDWVYPYWSPSLDKLAAVQTHLFFKWRGFWGTGPAFAARYVGGEPLIARLHGGGDATLANGEIGATTAEASAKLDPELMPVLRPLADAPLPPGVTPGALGGNALKLVHPDGGGYALLLHSGASADEIMGAALRLCFDQQVCRVLAWSSMADMPRGFPVPANAMAKLSFSYVRNPDTPVPQFRFDCSRFKKVKQTQCLST